MSSVAIQRDLNAGLDVYLGTPRGAISTAAIAALGALSDSSAPSAAQSNGTLSTQNRADRHVRVISTKPNAEDGELMLADRAMALKVLTSNLAMHLESAWRSGLFRQVDNLLDASEWDFSDSIPNPASFRTFLRMVIHLGAVRRPGLGANANGNIIAAWTSGPDRLTIECLPDDQARWVLTATVRGDRVTVSGRGSVRALREILAPFHPNRWWQNSQAAA